MINLDVKLEKHQARSGRRYLVSSSHLQRNEKRQDSLQTGDRKKINSQPLQMAKGAEIWTWLNSGHRKRRGHASVTATCRRSAGPTTRHGWGAASGVSSREPWPSRGIPGNQGRIKALGLRGTEDTMKCADGAPNAAGREQAEK